MQTKLSSDEKLNKLLILVMTVVGYIITFSVMSGEYEADFTPRQLFFGIGFGLLYLFFGLNQTRFIHLFPIAWGVRIFFAVQSALLLGVGLVLGPGGNWMIGLPMVGTAIDYLPKNRRLFLYFGIVLVGILPIMRSSDIASVLNNAVLIGATILFVVSFTQSRLNEQKARQETERLMAELEKANKRLVAYASQIEELATTRERNRLAREIHDNLGHYLTVVNVQIEAAKTVMETEPKQALNAMNKAQELTQKGLSRVRESVEALRVSPVNSAALSESITALVQEMNVSDIEAKLQVVGAERPIEEKIALALYRVAQEGLTNVRKHAQASTVDLVLDYSKIHQVRLEINDNGVGAADTASGFGLVGIRERIDLLKGDVQVDTAPNQGFAITVTVPCEKKKGEIS